MGAAVIFILTLSFKIQVVVFFFFFKGFNVYSRLVADEAV